MKVIIKERLARSKKTQAFVAEHIGITYNALYARLKSPTLSTLVEVAEAIDCNVHELLEAGEGYSHFYDDVTGEWLGIRKK